MKNYYRSIKVKWQIDVLEFELINHDRLNLDENCLEKLIGNHAFVERKNLKVCDGFRRIS